MNNGKKIVDNVGSVHGAVIFLLVDFGSRAMFLNDTSYLKETLTFIMGYYIYKTVCTSCNGKELCDGISYYSLQKKKIYKYF